MTELPLFARLAALLRWPIAARSARRRICPASARAKRSSRSVRPRPSRGVAIVRALGMLLGALAVTALLGVVMYLLSDINTRRYRLSMRPDGLIVERGRFLPLGFERYQPADDQLRRPYAPIEVPPGEAIDTQAVYEDRSELDRALFAALKSWAQPRLQATDAATLELGIRYVKRLEILPGLSEGQRHELRAMRADAALKQAEGLLKGVHQALVEAEQLFLQAIELGSSDPERARRGVLACQQKLNVLCAEPRPQEGAPPAGPALWPSNAEQPALPAH